MSSDEWTGTWLVLRLVCLACGFQHVSVHPSCLRPKTMRCPKCDAIGLKSVMVFPMSRELFEETMREEQKHDARDA